MNIITTGRLGKEFSTHPLILKTGLNLRYVEQLTQEVIDWSDTLASFSISEAVDLTKLKWIHSFGAGVDGFLKREEINSKILLSRTVGKMGTTMGEYCLCQIINFFQNTHQLKDYQKNKTWKQVLPESISGKSILIVGSGEMAAGISKVLQKNDMLVYSINTSGEDNTNFKKCFTFQSYKNISDEISIVINTLPATTKTYKIINEEFLECFQDILFINVGRGTSVNIDDLLTSLKNGHCKYATLDVFENEPLPENSPLWNHDKLFITPHQAAITDINDVVNSFLNVLTSIENKETNRLIVNMERQY